jgi:hypothetical protein
MLAASRRRATFSRARIQTRGVNAHGTIAAQARQIMMSTPR